MQCLQSQDNDSGILQLLLCIINTVAGQDLWFSGQQVLGNEATAAGAKNSGMSDSEMDGKTHIPSLLNVLLSRNRVMQMSYLVRIQINILKSISKCFALENLWTISHGN